VSLSHPTGTDGEPPLSLVLVGDAPVNGKGAKHPELTDKGQIVMIKVSEHYVQHER
jgi:hypothetical protein